LSDIIFHTFFAPETIDLTAVVDERRPEAIPVPFGSLVSPDKFRFIHLSGQDAFLFRQFPYFLDLHV
jgi:hypothetical protein